MRNITLHVNILKGLLSACIGPIPMLCFKGQYKAYFKVKTYRSHHAALGGAQRCNDKAGREVYFVDNLHHLQDAKPIAEDIALCVGVWPAIDGTGWNFDEWLVSRKRGGRS